MREDYIVTVELVNGELVDVEVKAYSFESARLAAMSKGFHKGVQMARTINWRRKRGQDSNPKIRAVRV